MVIEGVPVIVGDDGEIVQQAIDTERLTVDEVIGSAREQGIGDLRTCATACWSQTVDSRS
ncbi:hypothetical protein BH18ACT17_BH18ACT17_01910 [soil metagenome]